MTPSLCRLVAARLWAAHTPLRGFRCARSTSGGQRHHPAGPPFTPRSALPSRRARTGLPFVHGATPESAAADRPFLSFGRRRADRVRPLRPGTAAGHLDLLAQPPRVRPGKPGLAALHRRSRRGGHLIRFDERGHGLSDWQVPDFSFESRIADLEAVVQAAGFDRFALLGMAQGGPVSIAYAHRHPDRVSRLILHGSGAATLDGSPDSAQLDDTFTRMIEVGWARPEGRFRRVFTDMLIPGATPEQMTWVDDADADLHLHRERGRVPATAQGCRRDGRCSPSSIYRPWWCTPGETRWSISRMAACWPREFRAPGWSPWRATTTSCWPTSRPGRCSCGRSPSSSPPIATRRHRRRHPRRPHAGLAHRAGAGGAAAGRGRSGQPRHRRGAVAVEAEQTGDVFAPVLFGKLHGSRIDVAHVQAADLHRTNHHPPGGHCAAPVACLSRVTRARVDEPCHCR